MRGLMFAFRLLMYTLLSRKFWIGLGIGFFLASALTIATPAHAFYKDSSLETYSSFCGVSGVNAKVWFVDTSTSTIFNIWRSGTQTGTDNCYSLRKYTESSIATTTIFYIKYSLVSCSNCYLVAFRGTERSNYSVGQEWLLNTATTSATLSFQNSAFVYRGFSVGMRVKSGVAPIGSIIIEDIYDSLGNDYYSIVDSSASGGGTNYYPVLLYKNMMNVASTTCLLSSTSSVCTLAYETTTHFTLFNIVLLLSLFIVVFVGAFWVVKSLW